MSERDARQWPDGMHSMIADIVCTKLSFQMVFADNFLSYSAKKYKQIAHNTEPLTQAAKVVTESHHLDLLPQGVLLCFEFLPTLSFLLPAKCIGLGFVLLQQFCQ